MINSVIYAAAIVVATVLCGLLPAPWLFIFAPNYGLLRALRRP